jgi:hypothetical protein
VERLDPVPSDLAEARRNLPHAVDDQIESRPAAVVSYCGDEQVASVRDNEIRTPVVGVRAGRALARDATVLMLLAGAEVLASADRLGEVASTGQSMESRMASAIDMVTAHLHLSAREQDRASWRLVASEPVVCCSGS